MFSVSAGRDLCVINNILTFEFIIKDCPERFGCRRRSPRTRILVEPVNFTVLRDQPNCIFVSKKMPIIFGRDGGLDKITAELS